MALLDQPRIIGLGIADSWRRMKRRLRGGPVGTIRLSNNAPERLLLAPQDLRTADPTIAQEYYAGIFTFAGKTVETSGKSPFQIQPPSEAWEKNLHRFDWLRHYGAIDTALAHSSAQVLVRDWINAHTRTGPELAWDLEVASRRLISWFCHSLVLIENADHSFYRLLMRSMAQHIRYLRHRSVDAPDGLPRLYCRIALSYAAVCLSDQRMPLRKAHQNLDIELREQILPDGGHISRNCSVVPEILADLLPLRQACIKNSQSISDELLGAIERMFPAIRMFRHTDGMLARFNGTSHTSQDLITALLRYDETMGGAIMDASHSGYQRLEAEETVVIMDAGDATLGEISTHCHAGCLSFEMSSGKNCIITNCGAPVLNRSNDQQVWRSTAAHSTAVLNDTSSCRFQITGSANSALEGRVLSGPRKVVSNRKTNPDGEQITAHHDAYARDFGIRHQRMIGLTKDGKTVMGADHFTDPQGKPARYSTKDKVDIRFHIHPSVSVSTTEDTSLFLTPANGGIWKFTCVDATIEVEDSIFFSAPGGPVKTSQIVLRCEASKSPEIRWILEKQS